MGFFNMSQGDAPVFKFIADNYAISDNYHQAIMGGTGANFIFLGTADEGFFSDGNGNPQTPPPNQIENPNPQSGTNNWYTQDGFSGGSYVNCADQNQPGTGAIRSYLQTLNVGPNCDGSHYYLVNNYGAAYQANGQPVDTSTHPFTLPPQTLPNLAQALSGAGVPWKYYEGGYNGGNATDSWCSICNPFQFIKGVVTNPALHQNFADVSNFYQDLADGTLPAVSWVRPYENYAGHPSDSNVNSYEDFVASIANAVINNRSVFDNTAIFVTTDEGGGYYDSGYIQPVDFFGDGTRIPLMVISPYVGAGTADHTYYDHGSIIKFIEENWGLGTLSSRSRDNLPNPVAAPNNPYIPSNGPAIGDLMNLFDFTHKRNVNEAPLIIPGGI
jgi:phospholipase C